MNIGSKEKIELNHRSGDVKGEKAQSIRRRKASLMFYDALLLLLVDLLILVIYPSSIKRLSGHGVILQMALGALCVFACRVFAGVYRQIWRYSGSQAYMRLILSDLVAGWLYFSFNRLLLVERVTFIRAMCIIALNLLLAISIRLAYQYMYQYASSQSRFDKLMRGVVSIFAGQKIEPMYRSYSDKDGLPERRIKIAIVGAGRVGTMLAEELLSNPRAAYLPCCFIDTDVEKIGRNVYGITVLSEDEATPKVLAGFPIQEIVFALPQMDVDRKRALYEHYKETGCKLKVYDYPLMQSTETGKRHLREFGIEELLFRKAMEFTDAKTFDYYRGKTVLISGGGGSIGSELCRQIAKMEPRQLIILDVYENGAYDIQQELKIAYSGRLNLQVEIASVCDRTQLEAIFAKYRPDVVLHAAAHKHVPLMEHNCCEAIRNNVFGTLNIVEVAEKYGVGKFIMISTDKAVNPTNVMGATKRMCEMIVQSHNGAGTSFSATRFGNVLGSNGSVIPLFKRQIQNGGPVTLTDKRIIRYFMTIPEASQLVLQSGAMAKNGELYVLDMGKPVKILDLAENMIRLSGLEPYKDVDIIETGLRPGEKLYEELLIKTEELDKTENSMIFVERDEPLSRDEIEQKLAILRQALATDDDHTAKRALMRVVPTFHTPEEVNAAAEQAEEMKLAVG